MLAGLFLRFLLDVFDITLLDIGAFLLEAGRFPVVLVAVFGHFIAGLFVDSGIEYEVGPIFAVVSPCVLVFFGVLLPIYLILFLPVGEFLPGFADRRVALHKLAQ